jgi:hypothetical protein
MANETTKTGNVTNREVGRRPHDNVAGRQTYPDNRTAVRQEFPPQQKTNKPSFPDSPVAGKLTPDGSHDLSRGAATTGTSIPKDRVNQNGEF